MHLKKHAGQMFATLVFFVVITIQPGIAGFSRANEIDASLIPPFSPSYCFMILAPQADIIAVASLVSSYSYWSTGHDLILTDFVLAANMSLYGTAPATITIIEEGGEVGDVGLAVSDAISFEHGASYVILLQQGPIGLRILGGVNGVRRLQSTDPTQDPFLDQLKATISTVHTSGGAK